MCVSVLSTMATLGSSGGGMQAAAAGLDVLGSLAMGATKRKMAKQDAAAARAAGEARARRIRADGENALGSTRAAAAASGVSLSSGSVLEAERETVRRVEQDALSAILTGNNQAASVEASGKYYQRAAMFSAADSLFSMGSNWKRVKG